ncbi:MAG: putative prolin-rich transrane protein [Rhodocyclales bacterium]|nr:putative prolin-rich transrane protein [Rhodocyclales bacterium]
MLKATMLKAIRTGWRMQALVCTAIFLQMSLAAAQTETDPPSRVARLNYIEGTVSFSPAGTDDWSLAEQNRPLTIGDRVWVDQGSRSELHVGATAMRLAAGSSLEVLDLDDQSMQLKLTQGTFAIRVRSMDRDDDIEIDTPNLAFSIREPGEYRFDIDPDRDTTTVTVRRGSGQAYGAQADNRSVRVTGGRQLTFSGEDLFYSFSGDAPPRDAFDRWAVQRDEREDNSNSARYVSRDMTGYEELDDNGEWREVADYGPVWVPRVTIRDWAPYHYGHWSWIAPWGWTWVDDERWGFAPFHYGRWAHIHGYWAWVPGAIAPRPVYAPALVGFVGDGGAHWSVSMSVGVPGVAWFPLAPGEHYRPAYSNSPAYIGRINRTVIVNRVTVRNNVYINQRVPNAIAAMPANAFVRGQSAHEHMREIRGDRLREFSNMPSASSVTVAPVRQSVVREGRTAQSAPPERFRDHGVVARRQAPEAPVFHDRLARRFAEQQGTVSGAGPAFTPVARPVRANQENGREPPAGSPAGRRPVSDDRNRAAPQEDRNPRLRARPATSPPTPVQTLPPASSRPEEAARDGARPDQVRPAPVRRDEPAPANVPRDRARGTSIDVPQPTAEPVRRDPVRVSEPPPGNVERRVVPDTPRAPINEPRPMQTDRPRDDDRIRQERPQRERPDAGPAFGRPMQQAPAATPPAQQERREQPELREIRQREARPNEMRPSEQQRVEPVRPPRSEQDRGPRREERPADRAAPPAPAAPREDNRPQRQPDGERHHRRDEQRPQG